MLKEALELIQVTAREAQVARVVSGISGDGRTVFVQQGDELREIAATPPVRNHQVHTLVDLILYARHQPNMAPIVWHGAAGVVLLPDNVDRRDRVTFPLTLSKRFLVLRNLAESKPAMDQTKFIRLLRIDLGLDNLAVVSQFRKLNFNVTDEGSGQVQHGHDRLGKTITAKVEGVADLPDELQVSAPVYQQSGERGEYLVRCAVEIDTVNRVFQLLPMADELERVLDLAQSNIHERLTAALGEIDGQEPIPVYYGEP